LLPLEPLLLLLWVITLLLEATRLLLGCKILLESLLRREAWLLGGVPWLLLLGWILLLLAPRRVLSWCE
jgi:hypothetical protein